MIIKATKFVLNEHIKNSGKILTTGISHAKMQTHATSLGIGWVFIRDIVYFSCFIMFKYIISGSRQIDGMHFIVYLITGIVPWNIINEVLNTGSTALISNKMIIKGISFPITIIPTYEVVAIFFKRLFTWVIPFVIILMFGKISSFNLLLFVYYFLSMFILMVVINLIASAIIAISNDFLQLYLAFTRVLFFLMPILWSFNRISTKPFLIFILKLNPLVYIISGFRDAFVLENLPSLANTIYFWSVCILLFLVGACLQYKMRKYYADFM